jgi:hypothetical protein
VPTQNVTRPVSSRANIAQNATTFSSILIMRILEIQKWVTSDSRHIIFIWSSKKKDLVVSSRGGRNILNERYTIYHHSIKSYAPTCEKIKLKTLDLRSSLDFKRSNVFVDWWTGTRLWPVPLSKSLVMDGRSRQMSLQKIPASLSSLILVTSRDWLPY